MKNWLVCASVTDAARKIIEANGGTIETLSENVYEDGQRVKPKLLLVTIDDALYKGWNKDYNYTSYILSRNDYGYHGDGSGICFWDDATEAQTIYAWDGKNPNDPELRRGMEPDQKLAWEQEENEVARYNREMDERNRIVAENRDKPWLPFHDGE